MKSAIELIQDGIEPDADDIADALSLSDKEYRALMVEVAPLGEDEDAWLVLLSPGLIKRTERELTVARQGLAKRADEARRLGGAEWFRWRGNGAVVLDALGMRTAQVEWVHRQKAGVAAELACVLGVLAQFRRDAGRTLADSPTPSIKRSAKAHLDLIHAVDTARGALLPATARSGEPEPEEVSSRAS